uniref:Uncharacterized protein n=1 Tax=Glossina palpalis gambiensis TaxID=67801 RepID=A0A1B0BG59_9MUSC
MKRNFTTYNIKEFKLGRNYDNCSEKRNTHERILICGGESFRKLCKSIGAGVLLIDPGDVAIEYALGAASNFSLRIVRLSPNKTSSIMDVLRTFSPSSNPQNFFFARRVSSLAAFSPAKLGPARRLFEIGLTNLRVAAVFWGELFAELAVKDCRFVGNLDER